MTKVSGLTLNPTFLEDLDKGEGMGNGSFNGQRVAEVPRFGSGHASVRSTSITQAYLAVAQKKFSSSPARPLVTRDKVQKMIADLQNKDIKILNEELMALNKELNSLGSNEQRSNNSIDRDTSIILRRQRAIESEIELRNILNCKPLHLGD